MLRVFRLITIVVILLSQISFLSNQSFAQDKERLEKAIALYQHEDYEEALVIFKALREEFPNSAQTAYYLGMTYKQLQDVLSARVHLEAAATLIPPAKSAIPELVDILYQCGKAAEAKKWIAQAEQENLAPAQIAFLKGIILMKDEPDQAIASFDEAQKADPSYAKMATYYKGLALMQAKRLDEAKDVFRKFAISDPTASLSSFANEYVDVISRRQDYDKPFHANVGCMMQYDDNVVLQPTDDTLASGIDNKGDWRTVVTGQAEYNFKPYENVNLKGGYSFYAAKQFDIGFYNSMSHDISMTPSYNMDKAMIAFPVHYFNYRVNDKYYMGMVGFGPMANIMLDRDNMAQFTFTHNRKYFNWQANNDNDDKDSFEYAWSAGWFYFFTKMRDGFVNLRYTMNYEDTKGKNWTYMGNRITATAVAPVGKKMSWTAVADYFYQDFPKVNSQYQKKRSDNILTLSTLYSIEVAKGLRVQLQYTFVNDAATIGIYKYTRSVYGVGVKYEF